MYRRSVVVLVLLVPLTACGRLSFDASTADAQTADGTDAPVDAFDLIACRTAPNLVAYWPFDDTGTVATDYSASGQDGDLTGAASFVPGRIGGALELAAGDGMVTLRQTSGLSFGGGTGSFTFSYWVQPTSLTNATFIRPFELAFCTANAYVLAQIESDGTALFGGYDSTGSYTDTRSAPGAVQIGRWTHVATTLDRTAHTGQMFVDGVPGTVDDMSAWSGTIDCSNAMYVVNFGGWDIPFDYVGRIDDVRIYDRVLGASEIQRLASLTTTTCP